MIKRPYPMGTRQYGFTMVSAIFLITILFLLAAFMVGFRLYQDSSASLDVMGTRAYAAARSGVEWGAYNSIRNSTCDASTSLTLEGSLAPYIVTVTCARSAYNEGGTTVNVDQIAAVACNQPASGACPNASPAKNYVERKITIDVGKP